MADSAMVRAVMEGLRKTESNDDYAFQQRINSAEGYDYKVGAYGIVLSRWEGMAAAAGYPGADWRDRTAQDAVVSRRVTNDIDRFSIQYPDTVDDVGVLASVSFKYGASLASNMAERGITTVDKMKGVSGLEPVIEYVNGLDTGEVVQQPSMVREPQKKTETLTIAEDRIRETLVTMRDRDRGRSVTDGSNEELIEDGNQGIPAGTE